MQANTTLINCQALGCFMSMVSFTTMDKWPVHRKPRIVALTNEEVYT